MSGGDEGKTADEQNAGRGVVTGPGRWRGGGGGGVATTSKVNLVDLAGSEKSATGATGADAVLHREGRFINKSLTFLEQVTMALADQTREHVPFRSSKLTHFLKVHEAARPLAWKLPDPHGRVYLAAPGPVEAKPRHLEVCRSHALCEELPDRERAVLVRRRRDSEVDLLETQLAAQQAGGGGGRAGCESPADAGDAPQHDRRRRRVWEEAGRFVLEGSSNYNCGGRQATAEATGWRRRGKSNSGLQATAACGSREEGDGRLSDSLPPAPSEEGDEEEGEEEEEEEMAEGEAGDDAGHRGRSNNMAEAKTVSAGEQQERKGRVASGRGRRVISSPFLRAHSNDARRQLRSLRAAGYAGDFVRALRELVWEAAAAAASTAAASTSAAAHDSKYGGRSGNELTALAVDPGTVPMQQGGGNLAIAAAVRSAVDAVVGRSSSSIDSPESSRGGSRQEDDRRERTRRQEGDRLPFIVSRSDPSTDTWIVAAAGGASCSEEFGRDGDGNGPDGSRASERLTGGTSLSSKSGRAGGGSAAQKADNKVGGASRRRSVPDYGGDADGSNSESTAVAEDDWTGVTDAHGTGGESEETRRRRRRRRRHHLGGAFELFKIGEGKQSNSRLQDAKAAVQRVRLRASDLTGRVNDAKGRIDVARAQLQQHQQRKGSQGDGEKCEEEKEREEHISSSTLALMAQLKSRKREYRVLFEKLAGARAELRKLRQDKQKVIAKHPSVDASVYRPEEIP
ncbi:unnamed protein product [Ectocarpus sp. CCAP 1310/34]|nr:unnamed protein product [Ectocarpus sp. CCAP 1310/34]